MPTFIMKVANGQDQPYPSLIKNFLHDGHITVPSILKQLQKDGIAPALHPVEVGALHFFAPKHVL